MAHPNKDEAIESSKDKLNKITDGPEMTAGAVSGLGRLEKIAKQEAAGKMEGEEGSKD